MKTIEVCYNCDKEIKEYPIYVYKMKYYFCSIECREFQKKHIDSIDIKNIKTRTIEEVKEYVEALIKLSDEEWDQEYNLACEHILSFIKGESNEDS